ncbi:hypothetical protein PY310_02465 [Pseudarthrobacter sp. H3Y2-7]|uniref:hypothetical protein n=1 Tax=Pseudarthrobacter naphthalenicus TaxID=3031328 RepID=UPI0023AE7C67|nr:hypothetical protein [Pseudarthrobacter sp. H3Y2-7]MDE8667442.1 hypothetical protein [Pseudarthrobacter sp. H3Y2-7]
MSVREPMRLRKAMLAGMVALALTGAGTAIAWSAGDPPSPSPTPTPSASGSAPGKAPETAPGAAPGQPGEAHKSQRPQQLHGESVVKKADGTFETQLTQRGTVDSVSSTSVTVKSEDGFTQNYAVNAETQITMFPAPAADGSPSKGADGKKLKPTAGTIADIAAGDAVRISGVKNGDRATAAGIVKGAPARADKGLGLGKGHGKGHANGRKATTSKS